MKKILGLDIGSASVGWAFILEDELGKTEPEIKKLGVRVIPMGKEQREFETGSAITKNADRRMKRGTRRNNQRYKLRKRLLVNKLTDMGIYPFSVYGNRLKEEVEKGMHIASFIYDLRAKAVKEKLTLQEIGRIFYHLNQKRGYKSNRKANIGEGEKKDQETDLGKIETLDDYLVSERLTIGEYFSNEFKLDPYKKVKENVFLRKRFIEEFNKIWETQKKYYPEILNNENYKSIKEDIIYYQRPLKSQKGLVSNCQFEYRHKAAPKSSPVFQWFRTWQMINYIKISSEAGEEFELDVEQKKELFELLQDVREIKAEKILKQFKFEPKEDYSLNFDKIEGNRTRTELLKAFKAAEVNDIDLLKFDPLADDFSRQPFYHLWHLVYSVDDPNNLIKALVDNFNFSIEQAKTISKVSFKSDHGSLSTRAMRKLLPYLINGLSYDRACAALRENSNGKNEQYVHTESMRKEKGIDKKQAKLNSKILS
jgi:CRISPR-associated endonuclease Csn1